MSLSLRLALADGRQWVIRSIDEKAAAAVAELGKVMRLRPASETCGPGREGRELCVAAFDESDTSDPSHVELAGAVVCGIDVPTDRDTLLAQVMRIASTIAWEALGRGGMLLHGALAEYRGGGFIMAGPSAVGKTTASRRLPLPWRSLSDDSTLVVRDRSGQYWAHPWPTWSRFWPDGPGGSWAVEQAVPLRAVFFIDKASSDKMEPVVATQATALILESAVDLARAVLSSMPGSLSPVSVGVRTAKALALAVPAYSLKMSLEGRFWEEIERVLPETGDRRHETGDRVPPPGIPARVPAEGSTMEPSRFADGSLRVVCTGTSMNPTLSEHDLLDVRPYGPRRVCSGDVVCFRSPDTGRTVVHRVVSVGGGGTGDGRPQGGIRTRGDNNLADDAWALQAGDIIGRVRAAQRGARRRAIVGGRLGLVGVWFLHLGQRVRMRLGLVPHTLYSLVTGLGPFDYLLPGSLRTRLVRFDARHRVFLKLLIGRQMVGQYDGLRDEWRIRRPYRLFLREQTLRQAVTTLKQEWD